LLDFNALKGASKSSLDTLVKEAEKLNQNENKTDDRFWQPEVDKAGNGYAVIRFLPAPKGEDIPWVRVYDHGFQGPGGWYIENSRTTIGESDPVSEHNSTLWNSGLQANKDIVSKGLPGFKGSLKRRVKYFSNILVVEDPSNPKNNGKVFLYRYGPKIFEKLQEAMKPQFADEQAINPFDLWKGSNFKIKIRNVEGYRNYDKSEFSGSSAIYDDDDKLKALWESEYLLGEFIDPKNFKSHAELTTRMMRVLGTATSHGASSREEEVSAGAPKAAKTANAADVPWDDGESVDTDEDPLSFFKKLAEDD
jgi:hypothetical protein